MKFIYLRTYVPLYLVSDSNLLQLGSTFCRNAQKINHIFNQSHIFWKSKVKHTGADVACFFQDAKLSLIKHKTGFLEASYGTSQTSKL